MTTADMGHQATLSINGVNTEFSRCSLKRVDIRPERDGIRGTRSRNVLDVTGNTTTGPYSVAGAIVLEPTAVQLNALAVLAIGAGGNIAEALTEFNVIVDPIYNEPMTYANCAVDSFTLRGQQGGIIEVTLDLVGKTESTAGAVTVPVVAIPFIMSDCTLTMGNVAVETIGFELSIQNNIDRSRFANAKTLTDVSAGERVVTMQTTHAADTAALEAPAVAGLGATNSLVLNNGTNSVTFTFAALQAVREDPDIDKTEILLTKNWDIRRTSGTAEIAVAIS